MHFSTGGHLNSEQFSLRMLRIHWLKRSTGLLRSWRALTSHTMLHYFPQFRVKVWPGSRTSQWFTLAPFAYKGRWRNFHVLGAFVFRAQFQHFLSAFWRSFFAMQLAPVSMITITPILSLSVFSLQRTRLFRTCGELWRTRGELWLYFEMQRRLDLWSFSWSSRRSREAPKWAKLAFRDWSIDHRTDPRR